MRGPASYGYQPIDLISMVYASFCIVSIMIGMDRVPHAPAWLAGISGFLLLAYLIRFVPQSLPRPLQFLRDSYPLWALPGGYASAGVVNRAYTTRYFDDLVLGWELAIFGGHPHARLAALFPYVPLSEFLHLCYYAYLWLLPVLGFSLVLGGRSEQFRQTATAVGLTYYACFAFFIVFPVLGPYYTFEPVDAPGALFIGLVHRTLENGAALGTAFPSSHCAVAVAIAVCAWRYSVKPLAVGVTVVTIGIVLGTMYGGFHYAIDAAAGVVVGAILGWGGPWVHRVLTGVGGWGKVRESTDSTAALRS